MLFLLDKELQRLRIAMKSLLAANDEKVRGHVMSHRAGCVCSACTAVLKPAMGAAVWKIRSSSYLQDAPRPLPTNHL